MHVIRMFNEHDIKDKKKETTTVQQQRLTNITKRNERNVEKQMG